MFRAKIAAAQEQIKLILDNEREPKLAEDVPHTYEDKYLLAEFITNSTFCAFTQALRHLGITDEILQKAREASKTKSITIQFRAQEKCEFVRKQERTEESALFTTETRKNNKTETKTDKVVRKIEEYYWLCSMQYELILFEQTNINEGLILLKNEGKTEIMTSTQKPPYVKCKI